MSFQDNFPDFEEYQSSDFIYNRSSKQILKTVKGIVLRRCTDSHQLQFLCNEIAAQIPDAPTPNWGYDYLTTDFGNFLDRLADKKFHKFMDFVLSFVRKYGDDECEIKVAVMIFHFPS